MQCDLAESENKETGQLRLQILLRFEVIYVWLELNYLSPRVLASYIPRNRRFFSREIKRSIPLRTNLLAKFSLTFFFKLKSRSIPIYFNSNSDDLDIDYELVFF